MANNSFDFALFMNRNLIILGSRLYSANNLKKGSS